MSLAKKSLVKTVIDDGDLLQQLDKHQTSSKVLRRIQVKQMKVHTISVKKLCRKVFQVVFSVCDENLSR